MRLLRLASAGSLVLAAACGGGGGDGGGNTGPQQTLNEIRPSPTSINLNAGQSTAITVTALDTQGGTIANPGTPTFTTRSDAVAGVTPQGLVFGISAGTTTIDISLAVAGITKTASVTVTVSGTLGNSASVVAGTATNTFSPQVVGVALNGTVTWTFGSVEHNVTFSGAGAQNNVQNTQNASAQRSFGTVGNFPYDCTLHAGMTGMVVVR